MKGEEEGLKFVYPKVKKNWQEAAKSLGFGTPEEMLSDLYLRGRMSTTSLEKLLGWSTTAIARKLRRLGIIRLKGGSPKGWTRGGGERKVERRDLWISRLQRD